jgi:hypothetical protein
MAPSARHACTALKSAPGLIPMGLTNIRLPDSDFALELISKVH